MHILVDILSFVACAPFVGVVIAGLFGKIDLSCDDD